MLKRISFYLAALVFASGPVQAGETSGERLTMGRTQILLTDGEWSATLDPKNGCGFMRQNGPAAIGVIRFTDENADVMIVADGHFEPLAGNVPVALKIVGKPIAIRKSAILPTSTGAAAGPIMVFSPSIFDAWTDEASTIEISSNGTVIHTDPINPGRRILDRWRKCALEFKRP